MIKSMVLLKIYTHIFKYVCVCVCVHAHMCMDGENLHKYIKMCTVVIQMA